MTQNHSAPKRDEHLIDVYKLLVEMADRVSERRQSANSFYLSVNTAIVGATAYIQSGTVTKNTIWCLSLAGILICIVWYWNILSYKTLNSAKFKVINEIEKQFITKPFTAEWEHLDPDGDGKRHKPFHKIEVLVPWIFVLVYAFQIIFAINWKPI